MTSTDGFFKYDEAIDYCGPGESWITKLIPKKIAGVDINHCCYLHDQGWSGEQVRYKFRDVNFRRCIAKKFKAKADERRGIGSLKLRIAGFFVSWIYYASVRLGSLSRRDL